MSSIEHVQFMRAVERIKELEAEVIAAEQRGKDAFVWEEGVSEGYKSGLLKAAEIVMLESECKCIGGILEKKLPCEGCCREAGKKYVAEAIRKEANG